MEEKPKEISGKEPSGANTANVENAKVEVSLTPGLKGAEPHFFPLWGKFTVFGIVALIMFALSILSQEKTFAALQEMEVEPVTFLTALSPEHFKIEQNEFSIDTSGLNENVSFQLYGKDIFEVFPDTKIQGRIFQNDDHRTVFPNVLIRFRQGKMIAYRFSSLPSTQIMVGNEVVFQGEGITSIIFSGDTPLITAFRYPVVIGTLREIPLENIKRKAWQSFYDDTIYFRLVLPLENADADIKAILEKDEAYRKQFAATMEALVKKRGFSFEDADGFRFALARLSLRLGTIFSIRKDVSEKRAVSFFDRMIQDSALDLLKRETSRAKSRFEKSSTLLSSLQDPERIMKQFASLPAGHTWETLDQAIRLSLASQFSLDSDFREMAFELALANLQTSFDFAHQGRSFAEQRGSLIFFGENLLQTNSKPLMVLFEPFFASLSSESAFFDPAYLHILVKLEEALPGRDYLAFRSELFEKGKKLLEEEKIGLSVGREALLFLLGELGTHRDEMLKKHAGFITFLFSPEAESQTKKFKEQYLAFSERETETKKIHDILKAGGESREEKVRSAADYIAEAKADFESAGIKLLVFLPVEANARLLLIKKAEFSGVPFSARYDVLQKIFFEVEVEGEKFDRSVSLENMQAFIFAVGKVKKLDSGNTDAGGGKTEEEIEAPDEAGTDQGLSKFERVLLAKVFEKFDLLALSYKKEDVVVRDADAGMLEVQTASFRFEDNETVNFGFEFLNTSNEVRAVKVETVFGELPIEETFAIGELRQRVELISEKAKADKARAEEKTAKAQDAESSAVSEELSVEED